MKLMKTEIVEYIVAFVGVVGLLAYLHTTAEAYQSVGTAQISPMKIETGGTIRASTSIGNSAVHFRQVALADARV